MRSRLAPSPTGHLHVGNARTFLLTWLHVRSAGGTLVLRIDDLDGPRVRAGAAELALDDLRWLGLGWDEHLPVLVQSRRGAVYEAAARSLLAAGRAFPCVCTRSEVAGMSSAPHGPDGPRYPGTCRGRYASVEEAARATGRPVAVRFDPPAGVVRFRDRLCGDQAFDVAAESGAFVIARSTGSAAYQLATVIDDAESGVDLVVRGDDLLPSTARQILLQQALGLPTPAHLHLPLVVGADGERLAKRHGATALAELRAAGLSAPALLGWLAGTAGLAAPGERVTARDLLARYDPARLTRAPVPCVGLPAAPGAR